MTPTPATPVTPETPAAPVVDVAALQAELAAEKAGRAADVEARAAAERTAQFWSERARQPAPVAATPAAAAEEPDVDVLEIATRGGKAFDRYLGEWAARNGYVKGSEMTAAVNQKAAELSSQARLVERYPELKSDKSEFFQATALRYGKLKQQGVAEGLAMEMAAEGTELDFIRAGKLKTPSQIAADTAAEKEQRRRDRAAAGGGDRGGRASAPAGDDQQSDELDQDQINIAIKMLAVDGVTREQAIEMYKKRAKAGVAVRR